MTDQRLTGQLASSVQQRRSRFIRYIASSAAATRCAGSFRVFRPDALSVPEIDRRSERSFDTSDDGVDIVARTVDRDRELVTTDPGDEPSSPTASGLE